MSNRTNLVAAFAAACIALATAGASAAFAADTDAVTTTSAQSVSASSPASELSTGTSPSSESTVAESTTSASVTTNDETTTSTSSPSSTSTGGPQSFIVWTEQRDTPCHYVLGGYFPSGSYLYINGIEQYMLVNGDKPGYDVYLGTGDTAEVRADGVTFGDKVVGEDCSPETSTTDPTTTSTDPTTDPSTPSDPGTTTDPTIPTDPGTTSPTGPTTITVAWLVNPNYDGVTKETKYPQTLLNELPLPTCNPQVVQVDIYDVSTPAKQAIADALIAKGTLELLPDGQVEDGAIYVSSENITIPGDDSLCNPVECPQGTIQFDFDNNGIIDACGVEPIVKAGCGAVQVTAVQVDTEFYYGDFDNPVEDGSVIIPAGQTVEIKTNRPLLDYIAYDAIGRLLPFYGEDLVVQQDCDSTPPPSETPTTTVTSTSVEITTATSTAVVTTMVSPPAGSTWHPPAKPAVPTTVDLAKGGGNPTPTGNGNGGPSDLKPVGNLQTVAIGLIGAAFIAGIFVLVLIRRRGYSRQH